MSGFKKAFSGQKNIFLVAIHVGLDEAVTSADVEIARGEGADGIFLIKDYTTLATDDDVLAAYDYTRSKYPLWWIGVNLLDHMPAEAIRRIKQSTSGLWIDSSQIREGKPDGADYLRKIHEYLITFRHRVPLLFASIAFKYQEPVKDFAAVTRLAEPYADVLVTSGDATGVPADFEKIAIMRTAATKAPLVLASGVSVDNVKRYIELGVDGFIVNTSISTDGRLDAAKVGALRDKIPR